MTNRPRLYDGKGPWPQPNPQRPDAEAPIVLGIPDEEVADWNRHIGARYAVQLFGGIPAAIRDAIRYRIDRYPTDAEFDTMMTTGVYSKFLTPLSGDPDEAPFASIIASAPAGTTFSKIDLTAIRSVKPYEDMYTAPTLSLVAEVGTTRTIRAILIGDDLVLEPSDRNAFDLAKLFVMQGAAYGILFTEHPNLHFPFDSINAITQTFLPIDHLVFKLLRPHLRFQLPLNRAVLESKGSVITNFKYTFYAPFTADMDDGMLDFFSAGYVGVPGRSAYPKYDFSARPKRIPSDYGVFLERYYDTVLAFTSKVVAHLPSHDVDLVRAWANHCSDNVPGFPSEHEILAQGVLERTLARIVWDLSVGHGADHQVFSKEISPEQKFLRLRVPPPASKSIARVDPATATKFRDRFKARLAHRVFFEPSLITALIDTDYEFTSPELVAAQNEFKQNLRETEAQLPCRNYMPLSEIPASIQY